MRGPRGTQGFLLLEALLATAIFALAMIGLGQCVQNCLRAEIVMADADRARLALENRMTAIEMGAVKVTEPTTEELKDMFAGMKLRQSRTALKLKNEKKEDVSGLDEITLELTWQVRGELQSNTLKFYVLRRGL